MNPKNISLKRLRSDAKLLVREHKIPHTKALDIASKAQGFASWKHAKSCSKDGGVYPDESSHPTLVSDVSLGYADYLSNRESDNSLLIVESNMRFFSRSGIEFVLFSPTDTGMGKSIIDATFAVRSFFSRFEIHDYALQGKGVSNKVVLDCMFVSPDKLDRSKISFYRPETKNGDPRMWPYNLQSFCMPSDVICIAKIQGQILLFNFSNFDYESAVRAEEDGSLSGIRSEISSLLANTSTVANELLYKVRALSKQLLEGPKKGDSSVGVAIESALGIRSNSSKNPDYYGIEIKSGRLSKGNRTTIFAQVPDWSLSSVKSSGEILDRYGYQRNGDQCLRCTVSAKSRNSQGLVLSIDEQFRLLQERDKNDTPFAVWPESLLLKRLVEKHSETFWIDAASEFVDGMEYFRIISVTHTRRPLISQFLPLIQRGIVTMDHLIKRKSGATSATEKGPLFKIRKADLECLFPTPVVHRFR